MSGALEVDGLVAVYAYDDLLGRVAEALPLLIPHPSITHPKTAYCLANGEVNHVGEAVVMVVATDRYVAEDVCDRIRVDYEPLPAVVGVAAARAAAQLVHDDVPGNLAAHLVQEVGDAAAAIAAAPHVLELDLDVERSASMPMEGRGSTPAGTPTTARCGCTPRRRPRPACGWRWRRSSTCRWTGLR